MKKTSDFLELPMLKTVDFFAELRSAMRKLGLAGEEKFGLGAWFVALSAVFRNPLRLHIREQSQGAANYIVRCVAKLMPPDQYVELSPAGEETWDRFKENAQHKVVYLPEGDSSVSEGTSIRFEIFDRGISRVTPVKRNGRIVEKYDRVEAAIAVVSANHGFDHDYAPRWLTVTLEKPPHQDGPVKAQVTTKELMQWQSVMKLAKTTAASGIRLPEWTDLVAEQAGADYRIAQTLPAFLQAWKTMALVRSLSAQVKSSQRAPVVPNLDDFARANLLLRKLFVERNRFPSTKRLLSRITPPTERVGVINPVTGKGVVYGHMEEQRSRWQMIV